MDGDWMVIEQVIAVTAVVLRHSTTWRQGGLRARRGVLQGRLHLSRRDRRWHAPQDLDGGSADAKIVCMTHHPVYMTNKPVSMIGVGGKRPTQSFCEIFTFVQKGEGRATVQRRAGQRAQPWGREIIELSPMLR